MFFLSILKNVASASVIKVFFLRVDQHHVSIIAEIAVPKVDRVVLAPHR